VIRWVIICGALAGLSGTVKARLDETPFQCQQRYGQLVGKIPSHVPGSDPEAEVYRKEETDITIHYKSGRAWHLAFVKTGMNEQDRRIFLGANGGGEGWPDPGGERFLGHTYWVSHRGQRAAIHFAAGKQGVMEIMNFDCVQGLAVAREARLRAAMRDAVGLRAGAGVSATKPRENTAPAAAEKSSPPAADPLKGF
jgi:hypothetical protein